MVLMPWDPWSDTISQPVKPSPARTAHYGLFHRKNMIELVARKSLQFDFFRHTASTTTNAKKFANNLSFTTCYARRVQAKHEFVMLFQHEKGGSLSG